MCQVRRVPIDPAFDPVQAAEVGGLPNHPAAAAEIGFEDDIAKPKGPVKRRADPEGVVKFFGEVKDCFAAAVGFDRIEKCLQFPVKLCPVESILAAAIAEKFKVDRGRKSRRIHRDGSDEIGRLIGSRPAKREEMIGAAMDAGRAGAGPILGEPPIAEITSLGRLDVGEVDTLGAKPGPIDLALMM